MQVHGIKWVFVIPKHTPAQWLAACVSAIPQRGESGMTKTMVICSTEKDWTPHAYGCTCHVSYAVMLRWFADRRNVLQHSYSSCSYSCSAADRGDAHRKREPAHTSIVTVGMSVTAQIVMRSLRLTRLVLETGRLRSSKTEESTACSFGKARGQSVLVPMLVLSSGYRGWGASDITQGHSQ